MKTPEELAQWLADRAGKLTASRMADAMSYLKNGERTAKGVDLMHCLLAERLTGSTVRNYVTDSMQWGIEKQSEALAAYEAASGHLVVAEDALFDHPRIDSFAATPDALINGGEGLAEVKCPTTTTYIRWRLAKAVPEEHKPQMIAQLACTGRAWCDFVAFDPRVRGDLDAQLMVVRFTPTPEEIAKVEAEAKKFLSEVEQLWEALTTKAA